MSIFIIPDWVYIKLAEKAKINADNSGTDYYKLLVDMDYYIFEVSLLIEVDMEIWEGATDERTGLQEEGTTTKIIKCKVKDYKLFDPDGEKPVFFDEEKMEDLIL